MLKGACISKKLTRPRKASAFFCVWSAQARLSFAEASAAKAGGLEKTAHLKVIDPLFAEGEMSNNLFVAETPRETIQELFLTTSQS